MLSRQSLKLQLHLPHMTTSPEEDEVAVVLEAAEAAEMMIDLDKHPLQRLVHSL